MSPLSLIKPSINVALQAALFSLFLCADTSHLHAQRTLTPQTLFDPASPDATKQVRIHKGNEADVTTSIENGGLAVKIKVGTASYPCMMLYPAGGEPWNLSSYGHVDAKITNTGDQNLNLNVQVDNEGYGAPGPSWNLESKIIAPGQIKTIRVYFGYSNGFHPGFKLKTDIVKRVCFFTRKVSADTSFRIESLRAAGSVGEKVGIDPDATVGGSN